jgi:hypothetical protein
MTRRDDENGFRFAPEDAPTLRPARRWAVWALAAAGVAVLAAAGAYVYRNPLSAPEWLQKTKVLPKPAPTVVYKWRDKAGEWHISDSPPGEGIAYERLEYHRDANVLPLPPQLRPKD